MSVYDISIADFPRLDGAGLAGNKLSVFEKTAQMQLCIREIKLMLSGRITFLLAVWNFRGKYASFLIKAINLAKNQIGMPKKEEPRVWTNFFRD